MKHFIWMLLGIFISGLLLGSLSACGGSQFSTAIITTTKSAGEPAEAAPPSSPDAEPEESPPAEAADSPTGDDEARRLAYGRVLWDAYQEGVLPDGSPLDWTGTEAAAENEFALADVDGDGEEELFLLWNNAITAGMRGIVFGYRDGAVYEELSEFPLLTVYSNGVITADWSHNQGLAGRVWPYNLYQYNAESGVYELRGVVDAWDLELRDTDYEGNPFPKDLDTDGDGLLYYLLPDWEEPYNVSAMVDGAAHEAWLDSFVGGAEVVSMSLQPLTEENIAALGCPRPDPAG